MITKFFPKRDTFTSFLIPLHRLRYALINARLFFRISLHIFLSLFTTVRLFPRHGTFIFSPTLLYLFLSLLTIMRFFLLEIRCRFYLFAIAMCFFFLSRHNAFTFFPVSETRRSPSLSKVYFAIRGYGNTRTVESDAIAKEERRNMNAQVTRYARYSKVFLFARPVSDLRKHESKYRLDIVVIHRSISRKWWIE